MFSGNKILATIYIPAGDEEKNLSTTNRYLYYVITNPFINQIYHTS